MEVVSAPLAGVKDAVEYRVKVNGRSWLKSLFAVNWMLCFYVLPVAFCLLFVFFIPVLGIPCLALWLLWRRLRPYESLPRGSGDVLDPLLRLVFPPPLAPHLLAYFPISIVRLGPPPRADQKLLFAVHPHGVLGFSRLPLLKAFSAFLSAAVPGPYPIFLGASIVFHTPWLREVSLSWGCVEATPANAAASLSAHGRVAVIPGGIMEQVSGRYGEDEVYLSSRVGFCRVAADCGAAVVPVFVFGETSLHHVIPFPPRAARVWAARVLRVSTALPIGPVYAPHAPLPRRIVVAIGEPVVPRKGEAAEALHARYVAALRALHAAVGPAVGYGRELKVR